VRILPSSLWVIHSAAQVLELKKITRVTFDNAMARGL